MVCICTDTCIVGISIAVEELHSSQQQSQVLSREDDPPRSLSCHQLGAGAARIQDSMNTSIWASFTSAYDGTTVNPLKLHQVGII